MKRLMCSLLVALFSAIAPEVSAFASGPGCAVHVGVGGSVPYDTTVEVTGPEGSTTIIFGDRSPDFTGRTSGHVYEGVGAFTVTGIVNGNDGLLYRCHDYVQTTPYDGRDLYYALEESTQWEDSSEFGLIQVLPTGGSIEGDNNVVPVIIGDNNNVTINGDKTVTNIKKVMPEVGLAADQPVHLTFWQKFWLPEKVFLRGVIEVLEGWFDLNLP